MKIVAKRRIILYTAIVAIIAAGIWLMAFRQDPKPVNNAAVKNYYTISDQSVGLSFNVSKKFSPIPREELAAMNPGFTYGFRAVSDLNTICILSQIKLTAGGTITPTELRDGILGEIKKLHPDATITNESTVLNPVKFGEAQGILLEILYTEGASQVKRVEIIALGKTNEVIAYCQSLAADNPQYYNDFTIFFSSLKLNS